MYQRLHKYSNSVGYNHIFGVVFQIAANILKDTSGIADI